MTRRGHNGRFPPIADIRWRSDASSMSYKQPSSLTLGVGCLPAAIFGLMVGAPAAFLTVMGECVGKNGHVGSCPHERLELLTIVLVTGALCLLITWATNRMVRGLAQQDRGPGWGVVAGFGLAAALVLMLFALLVAVG